MAKNTVSRAAAERELQALRAQEARGLPMCGKCARIEAHHLDPHTAEGFHSFACGQD